MVDAHSVFFVFGLHSHKHQPRDTPKNDCRKGGCGSMSEYLLACSNKPVCWGVWLVQCFIEPLLSTRPLAVSHILFKTDVVEVRLISS